ALRALSAKAGLSARIDEVAQHQREFTRILNDMVAAHFRGRTTEALTHERLARFEAERREFDALLAAGGGPAETKMTENEDKAKIQVQTGAATVDWLGELFSQTMNETLPMLQGVYKLMRDTVRLQEQAKSYANQADAAQLPAIEQEAKSTVKTAGTVTRKFSGRMRSQDGKAQVAKITQATAKLEAALVGNEGAFAAHRDNLQARAQLAALTQTLAKIENDYVDLLTEAEQAVQGLNEQAKTNSAQGVSRALIIISCVVGAGLLIGGVFGVFFANRMVGPIRRITGPMQQLAEGMLNVAVPEHGRRDEIGDMAAALQVFKENAVESERLVKEREVDQESKAQRAQRVSQLCIGHETSVTGMLDALNR